MEPVTVQSKFLHFIWDEQKPNRKTRDVSVYSADGTLCLGMIKWWSAWRQYTFQPEPNTVFDTKCLTDILRQIDLMNVETRKTWGKK